MDNIKKLYRDMVWITTIASENNHKKVLIEIKEKGIFDLGQANCPDNIIEVISGWLIINGSELREGGILVIKKGETIEVTAMEESAYVMETYNVSRD